MTYGHVKLLLFLLVGASTFWYVMRYQLHMLQLNTYINKEQCTWLRKNFLQVWTLPACSLLGALQLIFNNVVIDVVNLLFLLLVLYVFRAYKRIFVKKPLHFTGRIDRLIATDCIISLLIILVAVVIFVINCAYLSTNDFLNAGRNVICGTLTILTGLQIVFVMLANIVNVPIEKCVRNYYINDAKEILKQRPDLKIIGITGSYGKTSMKFYLQTLLQAKYDVLVTPESYNTPMGIVKTIRESLLPTHDIFICEMGARYVGEIKEICDIVHPDLGIITSIGPAHLETFVSLENIQKTKFELADALPENSCIILNGDSELVVKEEERRRKVGIRTDLKTVFYGTKTCFTDISFMADNITASSAGTSFACNGVDFHTKLVGEHNVVNIVGTIACANTLGVDLNTLKIPVRRIMPVPHRLELKKHGNITILDDAFNSNPAGSKAAVETLALFDGIRILITPGMVELGDRELEYNEQFGKIAAKCCDYILLVGKKRAEVIKIGALSAGFAEKNISVFPSFNDAYNFALTIGSKEEQKIILIENDLPDNY